MGINGESVHTLGYADVRQIGRSVLTKNWTDTASAVAAVVAAVAALASLALLLLAAIYARRQLNEARRSRHAQLLMDLSRRWDEDELNASRQKAVAHQTPAGLLQAVQTLEHDNSLDFYVLLRVPNFFEDVAALEREAALSVELIRTQFKTVIKDTLYHWMPTIRHFRQHWGDGIYEGFETLAKRMD